MPRLLPVIALLIAASVFCAEEKLTNTTVTAALDTPHEKGKNLVWCNTFQLAWDALGHGFCGEALRLEGTPPLEKLLNASTAGEKDLDADSMYVKTGVITKALLDEINSTLKKRFGDNSPAPLQKDTQEFPVLAYAFLFKNLAFKKPFERQSSPLLWEGESGKGSPAQAFGIMEMDSTVSLDIADQIQILDDRRGAYIIELKTVSRADRLILAQTEPKETLKETLDAVREIVAKPRREPFAIQISDSCAVPNIHLAINRNYTELLGKQVLNNKLLGYHVYVARQDINFDLNEKGATIKSAAEIRVSKNGHSPRHIAFDHPFLLYMERSGAANPYLVIWIENADLFVKPDSKDLLRPVTPHAPENKK
jgi:hypothetical protein